MPTYRVPVSVTVHGYIDVEADDFKLAERMADTLDSYEEFDLSGAEWVDWGSNGDPKESP